MRRKDREVADLEGQLAILEQCPVCRVAINVDTLPELEGKLPVKSNSLAPNWTCCALTPM